MQAKCAFFIAGFSRFIALIALEKLIGNKLLLFLFFMVVVS